MVEREDQTRLAEMPSAADQQALWSRIISGSGWALGGKAFLAVKGILANILLARLLTPSEFGAFFLAQGIVALGSSVGMLGLNRSIVRLIAESEAVGRPWRAARAVRQSFLLAAAGALVTLLVFIAFREWLVLRLFKSPLLYGAIWLVGGWVVFNSLQQFIAESFRGFHDIRMATFISGVLSGSLLLAGLGIMMSLGRGGLGAVLWLMLVSAAITVALGMLLLRDRLSQLKRSPTVDDSAADAISMGEILRLSFPMLVANVTFFVFGYADIWVAGAFRPEADVAVYGAASRLVTLIGMPLVVVNMVVPPLIAELHGQGRTGELQSMLRQMATLSGLPALLVLLLFAAAAGPLLNFVFGEFYLAGTGVLVLLSLGAISNVWAGSCGIALMMTGYERQHMVLTMTVSAATVAMMVAGVQLRGIDGLAAGASLGLILQNVGMLLLVRKHLGIWTHVTVRGIQPATILAALRNQRSRSSSNVEL
ncbi:MAG: oligosaccharide flippase family protein [Gemmatimonadota bacterium]